MNLGKGFKLILDLFKANRLSPDDFANLKDADQHPPIRRTLTESEKAELRNGAAHVVQQHGKDLKKAGPTR